MLSTSRFNLYLNNESALLQTSYFNTFLSTLHWCLHYNNNLLLRVGWRSGFFPSNNNWTIILFIGKFSIVPRKDRIWDGSGPHVPYSVSFGQGILNTSKFVLLVACRAFVNIIYLWLHTDCFGKKKGYLQ